VSATGDIVSVSAFGLVIGGNDSMINSTRAFGPPPLFTVGTKMAGDALAVYLNGEAIGGADRMTGSNHGFFTDQLSGDVDESNGFVTGGRDSISGRDGNDYIAGDVFTMFGGRVASGGDFIDGGLGSDVLAGDVLFARSNQGTIGGNPPPPPVVDFIGGADTVRGGSGGDFIVGDMMSGRLDVASSVVNGNDRLFGDDGDDTIYGDSLVELNFIGPANPPLSSDWIDGGLGDDYMNGQAGTDTAAFNSISAAVVVDLAAGVATGQGTDTLISFENVTGSDQADIIRGDNAFNIFEGGAGNDRLEGRAGSDILKGGAGRDFLDGGTDFDTADYTDKTLGVAVNLSGATPVAVLIGGVAEDTIVNIEAVNGGSGNDTLRGDSGANYFFSGGGNDLMQGLGGIDYFDGGTGVDLVTYAGQNVAVTVALNGANWVDAAVNGINEDFIRNVENLTGGSGNDALTGDGLVNILDGGLGNDLIRGGAANDILNGGVGVSDIVDYSDKAVAVVLTLNGATAATAFVNGIAEDTVSNFEGATGGLGNDTLNGDNLANILNGGRGFDILRGFDGADLITGGIGNDTLTGGLAADRFQFLDLLGGTDTITDFAHLSDKLVIDASGFGGGLAAGALAANRLVANAAPVATLAIGQFLYETDTGRLTWDANGTAAGGLTLIAILQGLPVLTATDFTLIA
jgi:Ca2+-binding RTX toxin-like protein